MVRHSQLVGPLQLLLVQPALVLLPLAAGFLLLRVRRLLPDGSLLDPRIGQW